MRVHAWFGLSSEKGKYCISWQKNVHPEKECNDVKWQWK